jgi:hypothetical protein
MLLTVQVWMVLVAVHASGLVHDVADVVFTIVTGADAPHDDDCTGPERDCDCPAGCPNCHASHSAGSLPQSPTFQEIVVSADSPNLTEVPYEAGCPPLPELLSVYRPPRADSRFS